MLFTGGERERRGRRVREREILLRDTNSITMLPIFIGGKLPHVCQGQHYNFSTNLCTPICLR